MLLVSVFCVCLMRLSGGVSLWPCLFSCASMSVCASRLVDFFILKWPFVFSVPDALFWFPRMT